MYIDKFKKDDGYYDEDECFYENAVDFISVSVLGFCGCGAPNEVLKYIKQALELLERRTASDIEFKEWKNKCSKVFTNEGAEYFMWYYLDEKGFTNHGGSVPGWLTNEGKELLSDLKKLL